MSDKKKNIITHIFTYASAQYFSQFVGFFTAVFIRRFLGTVYMGIWSILQVVLGYANYSHLGTTSTVTYKVPILKGQEVKEEGNKLISIVFSFIITCSFICSLGLAIYALIFRRSLSAEIFIGLLVLSVLLICQRIYTYYMILLRAHKDFIILSKSVAFDAITNLSLIILIVSRFKLYGLYFVVIAMPILNTLFIRRFVTYNLRFSFDFKGLFSYIRYGFPLFINAILQEILNSIDRIMIVSMLGLEQLGFYSIAIMARSYGTGISKNFSIVIQSHFLEDFGQHNNVQRSLKQVISLSMITAYFMSGLLSLVFIVAPVFITYILPRFTPGIPALNFYLITTFFISLSSYSSTFLVMLHKQKKFVPIVLFIIVTNVLLNYIFIKKGYGISGVAVATAIAAFISFIILYIYALRHSVIPHRLLKYIFAILLPVIYAVAVLSLAGWIISYPNLILETAFRLIVFVICFLPLVYYLDKKTAIIKIFMGVLVAKLKKTDV